MDWSNIISLIAKKIGNRSDQDDNILLALKLAQATDMEGGDFLPWFLKQTVLMGSGTEPQVLLPQYSGRDLIRFPEEGSGGLFMRKDYSSPYIEIIRSDISYMRSRYELGLSGTQPEGAAGFPRYYDLDQTYIWWAPCPDQNYTTLVEGFFREPEPAVSGENGWAKWAPDLCIALGARHVMEILGEDYSSQFSSIERARDRLMTMDTWRREAGQENT